MCLFTSYSADDRRHREIVCVARLCREDRIAVMTPMTRFLPPSMRGRLASSSYGAIANVIQVTDVGTHSCNAETFT